MVFELQALVANRGVERSESRKGCVSTRGSKPEVAGYRRCYFGRKVEDSKPKDGRRPPGAVWPSSVGRKHARRFQLGSRLGFFAPAWHRLVFSVGLWPRSAQPY